MTAVGTGIARAPRAPSVVGATRTAACVAPTAPTAPPRLLAVTAATDAVAPAARVPAPGARPPLLLLLVNGLAVALVLRPASLAS